MLITFEGVEGSGKTTQIKNLLNYLKEKGIPCLGTREPGDTVIGKKIRQILLDPENRGLVSQAELFLYAADRAQHIEERIRPALNEGTVVVCDRFYDATTAYQGYARGLDLDLIYQINDVVLDGLKPDLTILFDLDPSVGLKRAWKALDSGGRSENESRFEQEKEVFHKKVRDGYLKIASMEPTRVKIIDASLDEKTVEKEILSIVADKIVQLSQKDTK